MAAAKKRTRGADVSVLVTVDPTRVSKMRSITQGLKKAGLRVEEAIDGAGVIIGSVRGDKFAGLEQVDGVSAVERQNTVQLPPPDAPVQ
jgi:hypothetical protein